MSKINLRDISFQAKQWDHPVKGLLEYTYALKQSGKNILKVPKKERELYCVALVALALKNDTNLEWWINIPNSDPPDGLVMNLLQEKADALKGYMRQVEVVEHRSEPNLLFDVIQNKMTEKVYDPNTTLVCLALTPAMYDLKSLAEKLNGVASSLKHIFVIFTGIALTDSTLSAEQLRASFTMVQLLPVFYKRTFDLRPHLQDFKEKYDKGQESRLIGNGQVHYGTTNPKFHKIAKVLKNHYN